VSDTVGFIRDLPHTLVESFEATLQEAAEADVLLHVVDAASPVLQEQMVEVLRVLDEIGAGGIPQILVFNKVDLLEEHQQPRHAQDVYELPSRVNVPRVFVSARTGQGVQALRDCIAAMAVDHLNRVETAAPACDPRFDRHNVADMLTGGDAAGSQQTPV